MSAAGVTDAAGTTEASEEMVRLRRYVHAALGGKGKGADAYKSIVKQISTLKRQLSKDAEAEHALTALVQALTSCVSALRERQHDDLLAELIGLPLWTVPAGLRVAMLKLLTSMVVSNSSFMHTCVQVLLLSSVPPPALAVEASCEPGEQWVASPTVVAVQGDVVAAIEQTMRLMPTLPGNILAGLVQHMPHFLRPREVQCQYLRAAFALAEGSEGAPIRDGLLLAVVEHLLSLDVEIKWEDIVDVHTGQEQEEGSSDDELEAGEDIFEIEGMSELDINGNPIASQRAPRGGWEGAAAGASMADAPADSVAAKPPVDESADKLDSLMELTFEHVSRRCEAGQLRQVWSTLVAAFERSILHTHRSKFTQFLLFYMCTKDPRRCCADLVHILLRRLRDSRQAALTRSACAAYLASLLARCAAMPEDIVVEALDQLAQACAAYVASVDGSMPPGSSLGPVAPGTLAALGGVQYAMAGGAPVPLVQQHPVFYAMVQALLYVLCYQLEPLLQHRPQHPGSRPEHAEAVRALVRGRVVPLLQHRLTPLAACLPSVAHEFVNQARAMGLADMRLLHSASTGRPAGSAANAGGQAPARHGTGYGTAPGGPSAGASNKQGSAVPIVRPAGTIRPLEMFFPFDPYLLRRSARYLNLEQSYVRWRRGHPETAAGCSEDGEASSDEDAGSEEVADASRGSGPVCGPSAAQRKQHAQGEAAALRGAMGATQAGVRAADVGTAGGRHEAVSEGDDESVEGSGDSSTTTSSDAGRAALMGTSYDSAGISSGGHPPVSALTKAASLASGRPVPLGLVAVASRGGMAALPEVDHMATSLGPPFLGASVSYSPTDGAHPMLLHGPPGSSPYEGASPMALGATGGLPRVANVAGSSPTASGYMGSSPAMAMSYEEYGGGAMAHVPAQLVVPPVTGLAQERQMQHARDACGPPLPGAGRR